MSRLFYYAMEISLHPHEVIATRATHRLGQVTTTDGLLRCCDSQDGE